MEPIFTPVEQCSCEIWRYDRDGYLIKLQVGMETMNSPLALFGVYVEGNEVVKIL